MQRSPSNGCGQHSLTEAWVLTRIKCRCALPAIRESSQSCGETRLDRLNVVCDRMVVDRADLGVANLGEGVHHRVLLHRPVAHALAEHPLAIKIFQCPNVLVSTV